MSLLLSKLLSLALRPLVVSLGLMVGGGVGVWRGWRGGIPAMAMGLGLLIVASLPVVGNGLLGTLEAAHRPGPVADLPSAEAIVVLGGSVGAAVPPRRYPDLTSASDRVWHAARLYHAGKAPFVLASGGRLPWMDSTRTEAYAMRRVLRDLGVPDSALVLETESATTRENARRTAERLDGRGPVLLVTSAAHMRRALATFRAAGVSVVPAPTDVRVVDTPLTAFDLIPSAQGLGATTQAIHEYAGYAVYWLRGDV